MQKVIVLCLRIKYALNTPSNALLFAAYELWLVADAADEFV